MVKGKEIKAKVKGWSLLRTFNPGVAGSIPARRTTEKLLQYPSCLLVKAHMNLYPSIPSPLPFLPLCPFPSHNLNTWPSTMRRECSKILHATGFSSGWWRTFLSAEFIRCFGSFWLEGRALARPKIEWQRRSAALQKKPENSPTKVGAQFLRHQLRTVVSKLWLTTLFRAIRQFGNTAIRWRSGCWIYCQS